MALAQGIIDLIRDEIGPDTDFADNDSALVAGQLDSLENIYTDTNRGNLNVLRTALICWRRRMGALQARSFDVTKEGSQLLRRQRVQFIERRIKELENLVDRTLKSENDQVLSLYQDEEANVSEYS